MHVFFPYFILLIVIFQFFLRKNGKKTEQRNKEFWEREAKANTVRKKDISNLNYIHIPETLLAVTSDIPEVEEALARFRACNDTTMLNLTGLSNTDLKMEYGPANLELLSAYDENCTKLLRLTVSAAEALKANGMDSEAVAFLEFGVDCGTDITSNYTMLAEYYAAGGENEKISGLVEKAEKLGTLNKEVIVSKLHTYFP
jgi:hypothetical protein